MKEEEKVPHIVVAKKECGAGSIARYIRGNLINNPCVIVRSKSVPHAASIGIKATENPTSTCCLLQFSCFVFYCTVQIVH